jgi:hypothetical protein
LTLGIAAGIAACSPALAQMQGVPAISNTREMHINGDLDITYDSNISHTSEATALARGIHPEDELFHPSAVFEIVQPIGRNAAFLDGNAGYDFHRYNRRLDHVNADVTGGGLLTTGPCRTTGFGRFVAVQSNLEDTSLAVVQNLSETTTGGGEIVCGKSRGFNLQLQGVHTDLVNSQSRQKLADHRIDAAGGQFGYVNERLGALAAEFNYSQVHFPDRMNAKGGIGDEYWSEVLGVSYQRNFGSKIKIQAEAGKTTLKRASAPPGIPLKVSGANYSAAIDYKMSSRLEFTVQATRAFQPSNRPGKLFDLVTHTEGSAVYNLGTRVTVTLGGFVENLTANQDTAANALPTITRARRTSEYITMRYRQSQRISAGLDVRHEDKETDLAAFNYADTRATVTLATSF